MSNNMQGFNFIVTGGAGFIGSHLVEKLVEEGSNVIVIDDFSNGSLENLKKVKDEVKIVRRDVSKFDGVDIKRDIDGIFHLACHPRSFSLSDPIRDLVVNAMGMLRILGFAKRQKCKVIFTSNSGIYGEPRYLPIDENHSLDPKTPYDANKLVAEHYCQIYNRTYGIPTAIARLATVYGPRQKVNIELGWKPVIAEFVSKILADKAPTIFGDGKQTRDFIYVSDVVEGLLRMYQSKEAEDEIFNLSTETETNINQLLEIVNKLAHKNIEPKHGPPSIGDIRRMYISRSKCKTILGWKPKTSLIEGIQETMKWHKQFLQE